MNEQTYLDTVCGRRKPPCKPKHSAPCNEYVQYTCQTKCGKICLRQDECGTNLQLEVNSCHCGKNKNDDC